MAALFPTNFRKRQRGGVRQRKSGKWGAAIPSFLAIPPVFRNPLGTALTKSGKWRACIWHPITKVLVYLGTYNTPQEAGDAYTKKKLEIESMYPTARKLCRRGVYQREPSKWYAVHQDPITRCTSYLGSYGSAEAAAKALNRNMSGFHSMAFDEKQNEHEHEHKQSVFRKPKGITLVKSGKWTAKIPHPITKVLVFLGTYNTPQEAENAYTQKKLEFESMFPNVSKKDRCTPSRWYAVIQDPIKRCTTYVGTYDTAEEAAEARNKKKREFDSMEKQKMQSNVVAEEDTQEQYVTDYNVDSDLGSNIKGNILRLHHDNAIEQEIALACKSEAGNSKITVANGDNCKESGMDVENGEILTLRSVIKEEFDMGVIDTYGQLIGEFSRMDDELWFI